jgi:hypothetical protein
MMSVTRQPVGLHDQLSRFTGRRFRLMAKVQVSPVTRNEQHGKRMLGESIKTWMIGPSSCAKSVKNFDLTIFSGRFGLVAS